MGKPALQKYLKNDEERLDTNDEKLREHLLYLLNTRVTTVFEAAEETNLTASKIAMWSEGRTDPCNNESDNSRIDKIMKDFINKKEDRSDPVGDSNFVMISSAEQIYDAIEITKRERTLSLVVGGSGRGKTKTIQQILRGDNSWNITTLDSTSGSSGSVLQAIGRGVGEYRGSRTNSQHLQGLITYLRGSGRNLIIDESHFANFSALEAIRRLYDAAGIGIVLVGQKFLFDQMRGRKRDLYDQILSRITVRCVLKGDIKQGDVALICEKIIPEGLDSRAMKYLYEKANQPGHFRVLCTLLERTRRIAAAENRKITVELLREVSALFMM